MNCRKLFSYVSSVVPIFPKKSLSTTRALERIEHDEPNNRFNMALPLDTAYVQYKPQNGVINLNYIFVPKRYRAIGIGQDLAREVLEYCADNDIKVVLSCPYLVTFYKQHPYPQFKKVVRGVAVPNKP